jgi:uncharacterized protein DUF3859
MLMPRVLRLALLVLALAAASSARAQEIERVEIIEWGIYRHGLMGEIPAPDSPSGTRNIIDTPRLDQETTTVPALVGMKFGYRFKVIGPEAGALVDLKYVARFPKQGLTNPAKGKTFGTSEFHSMAVVGEVTYRGYSFDHDWEVETGPWTLEIWHRGRKLAEKTFMVTRLVSSIE